MGDAQGQAQTVAQLDQVLLEAQGTGCVGAAALECEKDFRGLGVVGLEAFLPGQGDGVAHEGAGLA